MKTTICASRRGAILATLLSLAWMFAAMTTLDRLADALPLWAEGALNLSLLPTAALLVWGFLHLLRPKIVLRAGKNGLWLHFPPKTVGVVPWRHVSHFALSPDGRGIWLYLRGLWDVPDGCGERFAVETDERGQRLLFLPIRRKTGTTPGKALVLLEQWYEAFADDAPIYRPDYDEAQQRRTAARSGAAMHMLLPVLYFVRGKLWVAGLLVYILLLRGLSEAALVWQLLPLVPLAAAWFVLRRLLGRGIAALERCEARSDERAGGL